MKYIIDILIAGGGGAIIVYAVIKAFGASILNHQFLKLIETHKLKLNLEFDRVVKLNQKEFEVLPLLWNKIILIRNSILYFSDIYKRLAFNLNILSEKGIFEFVNEIPAPQHLKDFILKSNDKNAAYEKVMEIDGLESIRILYGEFDNLYKINKIFLSNILQEHVGRIHKYYFEAINVLLNLPNGNEFKNVFRKDFDSKSNEMVEIIGQLIKKRLRFDEE